MPRRAGMLIALAACADPDPPPPPPPDAASVSGEFAARCAGPRVVRCSGFDTDQEVAGHVLLAGDNLEHASIDPAIAASGAGSLRFDLPSHSGPNSAGAVWLNVTDDLSVQFGEGDELFLQWRQRFSPEILRAFDVTGPAAGWHQIGIGEGDQVGQFPILSCTELELVIQQDPARLAPTGHHSCPSPVPLSAPTTPAYRADEWMTFELVVTIGTFNTPTSRVQLWVAAAGELLAPVIDVDGFELERNPGPLTGTAPGARYGKLWLEPFVDGKDPAENHPTASTWYDELIVARQWIGDPL